MTKNVKYIIERPPLASTFELPKPKELLKLKEGDLVKLMFRVGRGNIERMWVIITKQQSDLEWTGKVDNDAIQKTLAKVLPSGSVIKFHPLDIIQIWKGK